MLSRSSQAHGLQAQCSYLLTLVSDPSLAMKEREDACLEVIDNFDRFAQALDTADFRFVRELLQRSESLDQAPAQTLHKYLPEESLLPSSSVDGEYVKRASVPPSTDDAPATHLTDIELPPASTVSVSSEFTYIGNGQPCLELFDKASGGTLCSVHLTPCHTQLFELQHHTPHKDAPGTATLRISGLDSDATLFWYGSEVLLQRQPSIRDIVERLTEQLAKHKPSRDSVIATQVTTEPLRMPDIARFSELHNRFSGERIFILGNGPSLNNTPLELLENEFVFGLNRVSLLLEKVSWRPTFFTAFDVRVVPDNQEEFANIDIEYKFFSARYKELLGDRSNHYWHHTKPFYEGFASCFEPTALYSGFGGGGTIAVIAIEIAFFLGFREIYLLGTDVSYSVPKTVIQSGEDVFKDGVKLHLESTKDDDNNHFDPRYFGAGKKWHSPNVRDMKIGFSRAASYIHRRGGKLMNATVGGELNEVARVDFESLF